MHMYIYIHMYQYDTSIFQLLDMLNHRKGHRLQVFVASQWPGDEGDGYCLVVFRDPYNGL